MAQATRALPKPRTPRTLCIDVGGTGLKALVLDSTGDPVTERVRVETPRPATPRRVLQALWALVEPLGAFERVSVGFPGRRGGGSDRAPPPTSIPTGPASPWPARCRTASGDPTRVLNDAGLQGYGVVEGRGVEMLLTLGTGMGCALFNEGVYVPNIELAHHPFRKHKTYEDYVGIRALEAVGKKRWNRRVARVVAQVLPIFNPRRLYLGGGNAKHLGIQLPPEVHLVANIAGLLGGIALWRGKDGA